MRSSVAIGVVRRRRRCRADPPAPRLNCSLTAVASDEVLLFGGEFYDGNPVNTYVYNELFKWNLTRQDWCQITSVNTPPPRCSHQCTLFRDSLYMFGGEFCTADKVRVCCSTSRILKLVSLVRCRMNVRECACFDPFFAFLVEIRRAYSHDRTGARLEIVSQSMHVNVNGNGLCTTTQQPPTHPTTQFHHYRDLWRLDLRTSTWEQLPAPGGPTARSGHRMVLWRNNLVLFGGFYEAFRESQWFNDLYLFSIQTETWRKINFSPTAAVPGVRSGFQMVVYNDTLLVNGGYTKLRSATKKDEVKVHRGEMTGESSSTRDGHAVHLSPPPNRRHVGARLGFAAVG